MLISGIQKFSILDYPEKTSCIVFTPGCNFRCGYCHNPEFVLPEQIQQIKASFIDEHIFFKFLDTRKGLLDGVVITGGEPTIHHDLKGFIEKVKLRGFLVKLDTNGSNPDMVRDLMNNRLVDYIAMDVKTSIDQYPVVVGKRVAPEKMQESIDLLLSSHIPYEFRTTLLQELHTHDVLEKMAVTMKGASTLYLQTFRPGITLDPGFGSYHAFTHDQLLQTKQLFEGTISSVILR